MQPTVYFLFCTRCGQDGKAQRPRLTLRVRFVRVDQEGTLYLNCICSACLGQLEVSWTAEEHSNAVNDAREGFSEEDIKRFSDELDQMGMDGFDLDDNDG